VAADSTSAAFYLQIGRILNALLNKKRLENIKSGIRRRIRGNLSQIHLIRG